MKQVSPASPASAMTAPSLHRNGVHPVPSLDDAVAAHFDDDCVHRGGAYGCGRGPARHVWGQATVPKASKLRKRHYRVRRRDAAIVASMPRTSRETWPPALFHVFTHSVWAAPSTVPRRPAIGSTFLRELARVDAERSSWICLGFCLMGTHYHLILDVDDGALPRGMQSLNFRYACDFNERHGMQGHVAVAAVRRGSDRQTTRIFSRTFKYVARNPVEASLCDTARTGPGVATRAPSALRSAHSFVDPSSDPRSASIGAAESAAARLRAFVEEP